MNIKRTIQINLEHSSGSGMVMSVGAIVAIIIFIVRGVGILTTNWIETKSTGFESKSSAEYYLNQQRKNQNSATIWYDRDNPTNVLVNEKPNWSIYFWMIIIPILMIMYNSWIAHKQYEMNRA